MFVGTGSDVGKSVINAAFCRIFKQDGYTPAPFKAQNMSLNSYPTPDGFEIGRAQAVQAEACGLDCMVEMNPVLLKPTSYMESQVVLHGEPLGNKSAKEYFNGTDREFLFTECMKAYDKLADNYNPLVIEGAGSISEMNLWKKDITNMRVAVEKQASVFLIADIDRGGVFGSVYGTLELLPLEERKLVKGIIINKFRGDVSLFEDGKKMLEDICKIPVVAVIPHFRDIYIDDEDSVVIDNKVKELSQNKTNVAVVLLPHMSNFTDFNLLERTPEINLYYARSSSDLEPADIIIIPGSKNTIDDMIYLSKTGLAVAIKTANEKGKAIYGICGGFQMMGEEIHDPHHVEGEIEFIPGLGLLPVTTKLSEAKTTEQRTFSFLGSEKECRGYEIHMGETVAEKESPLCQFEGKTDGYFLNERCWGTYMHGILDNTHVIQQILKAVGKDKVTEIDIKAFKEEQYNKLADLVRANTDMEYVYEMLD